MNKPQEVLILTGTCAVGKTTIANEWAKKKKGSIIECDTLRNWIYKEDFPKWNSEEEKFISNLAILIAFEYLQKGLSVAIDYVWSPKTIEMMRTELFRMNNLEVKAVRLTCDPDVNLKRDQERIPEHQMKERIAVLAEELDKYTWPSYMLSIDTTNMSVEEIVDKIEG